MPLLKLNLQGRFGNCVMQYLWARALAERFNYELCMDHKDDWVGMKIFQTNLHRTDQTPRVECNEKELDERMRHRHDLCFKGYGQMPMPGHYYLPYTRQQALGWLKFWQGIENWRHVGGLAGGIIAHRRVGDYAGYGYPIVSESSYRAAALRYCLNTTIYPLDFSTEERPTYIPEMELAPLAPFLPDFLRLCWARVLLRGNSSFSWVAGLLCDGIVLSPVIDGKGPGEHDCEFVVGNHPRLSNHLFCEDLYVAP